jgi:hypothetical protein
VDSLIPSLRAGERTRARLDSRLIESEERSDPSDPHDQPLGTTSTSLDQGVALCDHPAVEAEANWSCRMGNVQSIEKAIEALPASELAELRGWFAEFDSATWDKQIEQDAASGKLDQLAAEALADYRDGSAREL